VQSPSERTSSPAIAIISSAVNVSDGRKDAPDLPDHNGDHHDQDDGENDKPRSILIQRSARFQLFARP
jgi:hypothetical protein